MLPPPLRATATAAQVETIIKANFIFWQVDEQLPDGISFLRRYPADALPHVCVIDPGTRERVKQFRLPKKPEDMLDSRWFSAPAPSLPRVVFCFWVNVLVFPHALKELWEEVRVCTCVCVSSMDLRCAVPRFSSPHLHIPTSHSARIH